MTPEEHQVKQQLAITNELNDLQMTYDTRLLATAMMHRAVYMLRALVAAGRWTPHDVQVVAMEALADLHEPLDVKPREITRGPENLNS